MSISSLDSGNAMYKHHTPHTSTGALGWESGEGKKTAQRLAQKWHHLRDPGSDEMKQSMCQSANNGLSRHLI